MVKKSKAKQSKTVPKQPVEVHEVNEDEIDSDIEVKEDAKVEGTSEVMVEELSGIKFDIKSQGRVAIKALQKFKKEQKKKALFPEMEDSLFFMVTYKKPALKSSANRRKFIDLPHSDRTPDNTSLCLILPDLDRSKVAMSDPEVDKQANQWKDILRDKYDITPKEVTKIYTMRQIEREVLTEADKYKLSNTYDIFMVASKLRRVALWHLGGCFQKINKLPLPINPTRPTVAEEIKRAYSRISMDVQAMVNTLALRFGNLNQPISHLAENLNVVIDQVAQHCPGGLANIRACYIQTNKCELSLPIYVDFGSSNEIKLAKSKKRKFTPIIDELNTLPEGVQISVRADGSVYAVNEKQARKIKRVKREKEEPKEEVEAEA